MFLENKVRNKAIDQGKKASLLFFFYKSPPQASPPDLYRYTKCPEFKTTPTDIGLCQTYNGLPINQILKQSEWMSSFTQEYETTSEKALKQAYSIGGDKGFVFVVDNLYSPRLTRIQPGTSKFFVKVHDPGDLPRLGDKDLSNWIQIDTMTTNFMTNVELEVSGEFTTSTQDFISIRYETYVCRYTDKTSRLAL